jgi:1-phosphatidylinositol phosphodiesterase
MAFKGWPLAQCQSRSTPLLTQLRSGIRVLDIRISLYDGVLKTAHDILPMGTPFATILTELRHFLTHEGLREAVVVSIKQEDWKATDGHVFSAAVRREIETHDPAGLVGWFLSHRVPALGEVRGKAVLFSRFGADGAEWERGLAGLGIHPSTWPDSRPEGFTWTCAGTLVRVHDWYRVPTFLSIPEKLRRATRVLCPDAFDPRIVSVDEACELPPVTAPTRKGYSPLYMFAPPVPVSGKSNQPPLAITFLSASAIPFALPPTIARGFGWPSIGMGVEGVNARFTRWCLRKLAGVDEDHRRYDPRIRGWVLVDYFAEPSDMVGLLIELNWRGRVAGEEGWV